jgi:hypothetical protein
VNSYQMLCERLGYSIKNNKNTPIFIHSLWRAGSTYVFNVFRRSDYGYWAYKEPIHEIALNAKNQNNLEVFDEFTSDKLNFLNHPYLEKSYFYELQQTFDIWKYFLEKEIIMDDYFEKKLSISSENYLRAIIKAAKGRPVIQECRTSCRIGAIKQNIGGKHIYLWRNPWDQWLSFKAGEDYSNIACQIILGGSSAPEIIATIKKEISYTEFHDENIAVEFDHFKQKKLSPKHSYLVFYTLWCLGLIEGMLHADLMISIDSLSCSTKYRLSIENQLRMINITDLDFFDCQVPQANFGMDDNDFFVSIENHVHELLISSGYTELSRINTMSEIRRQHAPKKSISLIKGKFNDTTIV